MELAAQSPSQIERSLRLFLTEQKFKAMESFKLCRERTRQYWFIVKRAPLPFFITFALGLGLASWWGGKQMKAPNQKRNADIPGQN